MSSTPTVSIIIVSYNTRDMTCACIQSAIDQGRNIDQEIVVLDNRSSDGSADAIAKQFPQVRLIRSEINFGFARGNNEAAKHARGEYVLLLNPDTVVLDRAVERLVAFAKRKPEAKMWGGRTLFGDLSLNPYSAWSYMSLWSLLSNALGFATVFAGSETFNPEAMPSWDRGSEREVDMITGCLLLMKRSFWEELGGFDEKFFMYAEETDLCFRAIQKGAKPTITPTVEIIHYGGASETVRADKLLRLYSGRALFIRKHWPWLKAASGVTLMKLHVLMRVFLYAVSATIRGRAEHRKVSAEWLQLWKSRRSWENGYA
jgi:GT2 family glycosyltransferase